MFVFLKTMKQFSSGLFDEYKVQTNSIYLKSKPNIINVFTVIFDAFNASLLKKSINFFFFKTKNKNYKNFDQYSLCDSFLIQRCI